MTKPYWRSKIWALLHDPILKPLSHSRDLAREGKWELLKCMEGWQSPKDSSAQEIYNGQWLKHLNLCDLISSASDRTTIGRLPANYSAITYTEEGIQINHLLSGKAQQIICDNWHEDLNKDKRKEFLENIETEPLNLIKDWEDPQKVHWWLWRCYPDIIGKKNPNTHLLPAETRLPDASIWSHLSITSALAGGLAGYYPDESKYPQKGASFERSRPYLSTFSFSPVQELIKASRKMRDFWAGSWLLHYLSAKVAWKIAEKYGADTLLYPCLYQQPLIDHWLLQKYPDFEQWIEKPSQEAMLTAGFPNVLVMILPNNGQDEETIKDNPVRSAMDYANNTLKQEWNNLGEKVLTFIQHRQEGKSWQNVNRHTWDNWLKAQWQQYWVALPLGNPDNNNLSMSPRPKTKEAEKTPEEREYQQWISQQNDYANPNPALFLDSEQEFLSAVFQLNSSEPETPETKFRYKQPNLNVGSWWASTFDQLRFSLNAVKNARNWQIPTAFGSRSTISGIGAVVYENQPNGTEWVTEAQTRQFWQKNLGLFDGIEELNATEVLKRGLHQVLLSELYPDENLDNTKVSLLYPDLSSGVAGYLRYSEKKGNIEAIKYYHRACQSIVSKFPWVNEGKQAPATLPWGIPWIAKNYPNWLNPRLLNGGWLIDDFEANSNEVDKEEKKKEELIRLKQEISKFYPVGQNPTDWYVLTAGDGDGMGEWLKGSKLKPYADYIPEALKTKIEDMPEKYQKPLKDFLKVAKRMGPSTHSALSRALLDFSNQLVPYLTQERYAGRLIYGGGDDVLAYSNLWEWDSWLWDLRQCFIGADDPQSEFISKGDYWQWGNNESLPKSLSLRPLFTMGSQASISFGITIVHHSVPLAIALENLWEAEEEAKEHEFERNGETIQKDALQVRVIYGNGNILKTTAKFDVFPTWQNLINSELQLSSSIFEIASEYIKQYPIPEESSIEPWVKAFSERRTNLEKDKLSLFKQQLGDFIKVMWKTNNQEKFNLEISNWLRLGAFITRSRNIKN